MKKSYIALLIVLCTAIVFVLYLLIGGKGIYNKALPNVDFSILGAFKNNPLQDTLYINVEDGKDEVLYAKAKRLAKSLRDEGVDVRINEKGNHSSGNLNLYVASNKHSLPKVIDNDSINILYIPYVSSDDDFEIFRNFDVVIVKSISSYSHLKAINVRTAYIPDAIDIKTSSLSPKLKAMFIGDNNEFSLSLYLAKNKDFDIYGKNWTHTEHSKKIKNENIDDNNFSKYSITLCDQTEEEIANSIVNDKVIRILENGGLPLVRYNQGIKHIFQDDVVMYYNEEDFNRKFEELISDKNLVKEKRKAIFEKAKNWNTKITANKFIEIFMIMKQKKI